MKVLLSAYSCLPGADSLAEPRIGWKWAQCIAANGHEVTVITRALHRQQIEDHVATQPVEPVRFVFHDLSPALQLIYKAPLGNYVYYLLWQLTAVKTARALHRTEKFDRVQHITWGSFRVPSFMGKLGIPFTFGPVGGGEDTPRKFRRGLGWKGRLWDAMRRLSTAMSAPFMGLTYQTASEIIAVTEETRSRIPAKYRHKTKVRQAVGIDSDALRDRAAAPARSDRRRGSSRLELLYVGRLLPWKGMHLVLKALALLSATGKSDIHLTVIGSGSDLSRLQRLAARLKISELVSWTPWMPRNELICKYAEFDLFTFPSLHDSGGMVVLEAMTLGLSVLCLDLGGPAMAVDDSCGRVIPTQGASEGDVVRAIAQFLAEILADRSLLGRLSEPARVRAATLSWQANVDEVYGETRVLQLAR